MTSEEIRKKYIRVTKDRVYLKIGVQSFRIYQRDDEEDSRSYFAEMLLKALVRLKKELG